MKYVYVHILPARFVGISGKNPFKDEVLQIAAVNGADDSFYQDVITCCDLSVYVSQRSGITKSDGKLWRGENCIAQAKPARASLKKFIKFLRQPSKDDQSDRDAPVTLVGHQVSLYIAYVLVGCFIKYDVTVPKGLIRGFLDGQALIQSHLFPLAPQNNLKIKKHRRLQLDYLSSKYVEKRKMHEWSVLELCQNIKKMLKKTRTELGESRNTYFGRVKAVSFKDVHKECLNYI